jgi:hypothetical protein
MRSTDVCGVIKKMFSSHIFQKCFVFICIHQQRSGIINPSIPMAALFAEIFDTKLQHWVEISHDDERNRYCFSDVFN